MEEIDLKEVAKTFWSKKIHIVVILIIFIILGIIYTFNLVTPKYSASTTLILASINGMSASDKTEYTDTVAIDRDITLNSKLVSTYSELIKSKNILRQVKANLDIDIDEELLKKSITVDTVEDTELIRITVVNESSELATYIANELANVFKEQIKVYYDIENVQIVDIAEMDDKPSNINHKKDIVIFTLLGMVVSVGYVLIYNMLDTTIKSVEDIENILNLKVITVLPNLDNFEKNDKKSSKAKRGGKRKWIKK